MRKQYFILSRNQHAGIGKDVIFAKEDDHKDYFTDVIDAKSKHADIVYGNTEMNGYVLTVISIHKYVLLGICSNTER